MPVTSKAKMADRRLHEANSRMTATLEQIAIVCTDNMDRDCNHRMALDFVRQLANDALPGAPDTRAK